MASNTDFKLENNVDLFDFNEQEAEKVADYIQNNPEMPEEVRNNQKTYSSYHPPLDANYGEEKSNKRKRKRILETY